MMGEHSVAVLDFSPLESTEERIRPLGIVESQQLILLLQGMSGWESAISTAHLTP